MSNGKINLKLILSFVLFDNDFAFKGFYYKVSNIPNSLKKSCNI